jgi:hypothetical protein
MTGTVQTQVTPGTPLCAPAMLKFFADDAWSVPNDGCNLIGGLGEARTERA